MATRVFTLLLILEPLLRGLCVLAALWFVTRLYRDRLLRKYAALVVFLVADIAEFTLPILLPTSKEFAVYRLGDLVKLIASVVFLWMLARSAFLRFPALATFASRSSKLTVAACLLLGWISFLTDTSAPTGRSPQLHLWISLDRAVTSGLLLFVIAVAVFASWFPVQMPRNLARLLAGFLLWLSISWIGYLASNESATVWGNAAYDIVVLGILAYWNLTIHAAGETDTAGTLPQWDPDRLDQVTAQLAHMESQLSRRGY